MDPVERFRSDPNDPGVLLEYARHLYVSKDYRALEALFGKHLRRSYNLEFWMLYIEYVRKVSQKKFKLYEVYEFTLGQFEHYWDAYGLYKEYIEELWKIEDEQMRTEKIRGAYMRGLQTPMGNLGALWKDFEMFELELNKTAGKRIVSETFPLFQNTFQRYQAIASFTKSWSVRNAARLIDVEMENIQKLGAKVHGARMNFILNHIVDCFHRSEEVYFFYSEYMIGCGQIEEARKIVRRGMEICDGMFLALYCGVVLDEEGVYEELRGRYGETKESGEVYGKERDLVAINHLRYMLRRKGLEAFRKLFIELGKEMPGVCVFIYCAIAEYYATGNKAAAHNIFSSGLWKHPESVLLKEEFLLFLLRIGDEENARALFKRLERTEKMWDAMIEYEALVGSVERLRDLAEQKTEAMREGTILPMLPETTKGLSAEGVLGKYYIFLNSFGFLGLRIGDTGLLDAFLERLPQVGMGSHVLSNLDPEKVVELLRTMQIE